MLSLKKMAQVQDPKTDGETAEVEMNSSEQNGGSSGGVIAPSTFVFGQNMESRVVKRPAEEQLDPESADTADEKKEDPGEFPKASANVLAQRPIIAPVSSFKDKQPQSSSSASEGESDKPSTFKLAPATFGATRTTRTDEGVTSTSTSPASTTTNTLVKPAILSTAQEWEPTFGSAGKASSAPFKLKESALQAATEQVNGKGQNKDEESQKGATGSESKETSPSKSNDEKTDSKRNEGAASSSTDSSSKNNYFLKLNPGSDGRNVGFGVFGTFSDSQIGTVSFGPDEKDHNGATAENYFLQFASNGGGGGSAAAATASCATSSSSNTPITSPGQKSGGSPTSALSLGGSGNSFVFGQAMNERVTSGIKKEKGELETAAEFVFGQNLGDRIKSEEGEEGKSDQSLFSPDTSGKTLAENANAYAEAKENSRLKFEQVPKLTGEEEEENVLQVQCKLYIFDVTKKSWQERGRGQLRLNDKRQATPDPEAPIQSRLVMRTQGSLRVILNTKLWSSMILEKASSKSLRISALDSETKTPRVFLISSTPKDAEQLYRAIEYRIQELKHIEQMEQESTEGTTSSTNQEDEEESETKDAEDEEDTNEEPEPRSRTEETPEETSKDEVTSSTTAGNDGTLQSTDKEDSKTEEKADNTTKKSYLVVVQ